jgi:hypothetical protein
MTCIVRIDDVCLGSKADIQRRVELDPLSGATRTSNIHYSELAVRCPVPGAKRTCWPTLQNVRYEPEAAVLSDGDLEQCLPLLFPNHVHGSGDGRGQSSTVAHPFGIAPAGLGNPDEIRTRL